MADEALSGDPLAEARLAAGRLLSDRGYAREAEIILRGEGDDFAEVRIALALQRQWAARDRQLAAVLRTYADADFWDGAGAAEPPALADHGALARSALAA